MSKVQDVVSWVMKDDKILKLQNTGQTYDISDEVANCLEKANLYDTLEDKDVEVEIDEKQGQDGTIIRLEIVKDSAKSEPKDERPPETEPSECPPVGNDLIVKELTVGGVSVAKAGVIFKEEENVWYTLDSTIVPQKFKDECTKKVVEVTIAPQEKGNDVIKGYILKEEEKKEEQKEETQKTYKKSYNADMQTSIEAQASMNSANRIVQAMVDKDTKPDFVEKLITRIAQHNFKTIQDLKNKE